MPKAKRRGKLATIKRRIGPRDARLKKNQEKLEKKIKASKGDDGAPLVKNAPKMSSALFFSFNQQLKPPYSILLDTNMLAHSVHTKLDIIQGMMDCLHAKVVPMITDCVMAELEKLGPKYRVALRLAKDPRFKRLVCDHKGTYADDCLVRRVMAHKCYLVATQDRDLKRRIRKIPGVPIIYISRRKYCVERMPDAFGDFGF
ncbi:rRNA-processing protein FCF1 [Thecamonas trahens ATCC 50062]|uniref:rRNA-processing protein FCF1 n=1 Tax=Thecamonas trahens ATCC 50062 TaxID=461836 RepID=A0A0L0DVV9_THETB|nr:rRNA-processing protein FCF1 [Thecamonas trahens ATCC 50062]KNC56355.1 rRNA-processing protein FCF1 [Thecamonas trahens ATCC 50062]|eukprot:XP_013760872.1 rRNA-processing protein FCF1 [Thecamonas trahens ATCC 50062]